MYIPKHFEEQRIEVLHELIRSHSLATIITQSGEELNANHIPLHLVDSRGQFGVLQGHVARANPILKDLESGMPSLVIFQGPEAYISPSWYATKKETGKVVPTWNYAVVHAHGIFRIIDDAAWVRSQLEAFTSHNEAEFDEPWAVSDAPVEYTDKLLSAIVGIELEITSLTGKWKVSQNQPAQNKTSVISGLSRTGQQRDAEMASLVCDFGKSK
ncbi:transcriptional regulator [Hahella sp. CCB-MM4]|uniref:FMN-binding negative transcriptional regulator n=1 Tax=Hahella sp. (strain CCB-MM4) TaxID=1926491 RepID=UPI000B9C0AE5|nr:FMN-binding negative transcriptional regulator [Hahella sp. CCB-MM4]OZG71642.1 transcriptional regulator [Hahella sp. CCB-MM4]